MPNPSDIDLLLQRLRAVANEHAVATMPSAITCRPWRGDHAETAARRAIWDAWLATRQLPLALMWCMEPEDFLDLAYRLLLRRSAHSDEHSRDMEALRQGLPRSSLLLQLANSPQGQRYKARLGGLRLLLLLNLFASLPQPWARLFTHALPRWIERQWMRRAQTSIWGAVWRLAAQIDAQTANNQRTIQSQIAAIRASLTEQEAGTSIPVAIPATPIVANDALTHYYAALAVAFRGDPDRLRQQLATDYLSFFLAAREAVAAELCVDLGCGAGEWLEVLQTHGFKAEGVDSNPILAAQARNRGFVVQQTDALQWLRRLPDNYLLAVSALHLIEHLEFATLFALVRECQRVLKPGGLLLLETPNPENIWVATHTFYHDPTHRQPLTPNSLEFLVNYHGLETLALLRLHPYPIEAQLTTCDPASARLNGMTCNGQDFAVIARKTPVH